MQQIIDLLKRHLPAGFKISGTSNIVTKCPFHKNGQERKPSFSVSIEKGVFHCFTCNESGNLSRLLFKLGVSRETIDSELAIIRPHLKKNAEEYIFKQDNAFKNKDPFEADYILPEAIIGAYSFEPKILLDKGFDSVLLKDLEVGYDRLNNRVMYPLRDMYGNLAGFSGGITPLSTTSFPKYKIYQGRRIGLDNRVLPGDYGSWFDESFPDYKCENHDFLWNFDRVYTRVLNSSDPVLYITEGFKACMWMIQAGFMDTVALMGSYMSDKQQKLIHRLGCTVVLCLDNDIAGRHATKVIGDLLWKPMYGKVKCLEYPEGHDNTQPDDYAKEEIVKLTTNAKAYFDYVNRREIKW